MEGLKKTLFSKKGFTLIETLVAMSVFVVIMTVVLGIFIALLKLQSKGVILRGTQQNSQFVLKEIANYANLARNISILEFPSTDLQKVVFTVDSSGNTISYYVRSEALKKDDSKAGLTGVSLTSSDVKVSKLKFILNPNPPVSSKPVILEISLKIENKSGATVYEQNTIDTKTSVLCRSYGIVDTPIASNAYISYVGHISSLSSSPQPTDSWTQIATALVIDEDDGQEAETQSNSSSYTKPADQNDTTNDATLNDIFAPGTWNEHNAAGYQRIPGTPTGYFLQKIEIYGKTTVDQVWKLWVGSVPPNIVAFGAWGGATYDFGTVASGGPGWRTIKDWGASPVWIPAGIDIYLGTQTYSFDTNTAPHWYRKGDPGEGSGLRGQSHHLWNHNEEWTWAPGFQWSYKLIADSPLNYYSAQIFKFAVSSATKITPKANFYGTGPSNGAKLYIRNNSGSGSWEFIGENTTGAPADISKEFTNPSNYISGDEVQLLAVTSSPSSTSTTATLFTDYVELMVTQ